MLRKSRKQLTTRFLHRTVLFLFSFSTGMAVFFLFGNFQNFMDSTQLLILAVLKISSLATVLLSIMLIMLECALRLLGKKRHLDVPMLAMTSFCLTLAFLFSLTSHLFSLVSAGF